MNSDFYESIFRQYEVENRYEAANVDHWEPYGKYQIKLYTEDGTVKIYHAMMHMTRTLFENDHSDKAIMREFSNNLTIKMVETGMTQKEIANATGISQGAISSYIRKTSTPSLTAAVRIADALGCDVRDLFES